MPDVKYLTLVREDGMVSYVEATPAAIGAVASSLISAPSGVAPLDASGKVPAVNLPPGFVREVIEVANFAALPATGDPDVIYKTMDNGLTWMWGGTSYAAMSSGLVLGETSANAYRGDRGKAAYDHSQVTGSNPHGTTAAQVGAAESVHGHTTSQITGLDVALASKESGLGTPGVTSFLRSTAAGVRAWVQLTVADITDLATTLAAYLTKNNPNFTGTLSQGGTTRINANGEGFLRSATASAAGSDTIGSGPFWRVNDSTTSPQNAWVGQLGADNGLILFTQVAGNWSEKWRFLQDGSLTQAGAQRITAGGEFLGTKTKLFGAGSNTFGSAPHLFLADAETGYSNACAIQMTATGGIAFWTLAGGAWRNYWGIGYLGNLRNSAFAGGGTRPLFVDNSGDVTPNVTLPYARTIITDLGRETTGTNWESVLNYDADTKWKIAANSITANGTQMRVKSSGTVNLSTGTVMLEMFVGPYGAAGIPYYADAADMVKAREAWTSAATVHYSSEIILRFDAVGASGSVTITSVTRFTQPGYFNDVVSATTETISVDTTIDRWLNLRTSSFIVSKANSLEILPMV